MTDPLPPPLVPADCDLRDFQFMPVDVRRLLTSETWMLGSGDARSAAMCLWLESWHQVPAGSLPNNDTMLSHLAQANKWKKIREHTLRGWILCADDRLYHPVVAEKALEAWLEKLAARVGGGEGNAKRWGASFDRQALEHSAKQAVAALRCLNPKSRTLQKKFVLSLGDRSPPDSPPDSPSDSGSDRTPNRGSGGPAIARDREGTGIYKNPSDFPAGAGKELRATHPGSRANGTNPRALGNSPRQQGVNPRAIKNLSLEAWRSACSWIDQVKGTSHTWQFVTEQMRDSLADAAIRATGGHKLIADRSQFNSGELENRFRACYEQRLMAEEAKVPRPQEGAA